MPGTVITVSSRISVAELERRVRERVARDGVAALAAVSSRQRGHISGLLKRLATDPGLDVYGGTIRPDGTVNLIVFAAGGPRPGWFGGVAGVVEDEDGDYWSESSDS
jgi:hypothetical protein